MIINKNVERLFNNIILTLGIKLDKGTKELFGTKGETTTQVTIPIENFLILKCKYIHSSIQKPFICFIAKIEEAEREECLGVILCPTST
jgi:hypothetical protein